ncbi:MAG TPA: xanthine dehydrogenase molybdopterin binding subunit [Bacteroidales bacterium]|nr:xanthine dehydrogenase molybdopterin binding subunit [Bacteroidales bacterium]
MSIEIHHDSAMKHVTGQSVYINDIDQSRLLIGKVIYSSQAHAQLTKIDYSEVLNIKGVHCVLTASDIPGENQMGPVIHDEPCLADKEVTFIGQAIALIAAETEEQLIEAEKKIIIEYQPLPAIIDLETAIEKSNLIAKPRIIKRGKPDEIIATAPHVLSGTLKTNGQEHWYLETQTALAIPREDNDMLVYASSQNPSETQAIVSEVLGVPKNDVEVEVKRMGGAFGGKETQANHVAAWAALLAQKTKRPVKIHLFRDDDQLMTGKRHRFISNYTIAFDDNGKILAYKVELNADAGAATDLTMAILERAMLHADNAYFLPDVEIIGKAYKTNLPSNTAFRGFGGPQGVAVIENALDRIARYLKKDAVEIRKLNFYDEDYRNITPYHQEIKLNRLPILYEKLIQKADYEKRRAEIHLFNMQHAYKKRGLALTPIKFGISFTTAFLNQAGALVNIYTDGTVLVNHGGTEMGQGLNTKIQQIAALELGVSFEKVKVNATNTSKVPNTSATAASSGSDLNGMAVKNAIDKIKKRLSPVAVELICQSHNIQDIKEVNIVFENNVVYDKYYPEHSISFQKLIQAAYLTQISLSATGFYKTPGIYFDRENGTGEPFYYFAYGMAVSEVEIDVLTGKHTLLRSDIIHDVGNSILKGIDIGQVQGAFIQGVGWVTTEELKWDKEGHLLTHSPDTYKIPTVSDIPKVFNVELLENAPNVGTIRQSKAVGEPPFMLAFFVWLAIKDAISAVKNHQIEPEITLPMTAEQILLSIDKLTKQ